MKYAAILFDLDGTLIDSAPDLLTTLDELLIQYGRQPCVHEAYRRYVSDGSLKLLQLGFADDYPIPIAELWQAYLQKYQQQNTRYTDFYDGIPVLLDAIEASQTPWAVVTNKYTEPTVPIAKHLKLDQRAAAIVCGDTLPVLKPDPSSLLLACKMMGIDSEKCIYIGDSHKDIIAGQLAGMATIACAYGYIKEDDDISTWGADHIVQTPHDILTLLQASTFND
ncbi:MAG: phosphoglycolate phosphatase [Gammaproteobacteria bacterium]|nr:MAG: phosphoglycolate phosphatase [Gammaproteobacteria bacterium]